MIQTAIFLVGMALLLAYSNISAKAFATNMGLVALAYTLIKILENIL